MKRFLMVCLAVLAVAMLQNSMAAPSKFSGAYLGGTFGGVLYKDIVTDIDFTSFRGQVYPSDTTAFVGVHGGYNLEIVNKWIVGVKANYNLIDAEVDEFYKDTRYHLKGKISSSMSFLGVLGSELTPSTLLYVNSGVAFLKNKGSVTDGLIPANSWNEWRERLQAWVIGFGVKLAADTGWYMDVGVDCYMPEKLDLYSGGSTLRVENRLWTPKLEIGYNFGNVLHHA